MVFKSHCIQFSTILVRISIISFELKAHLEQENAALNVLTVIRPSGNDVLDVLRQMYFQNDKYTYSVEYIYLLTGK